MEKLRSRPSGGVRPLDGGRRADVPQRPKRPTWLRPDGKLDLALLKRHLIRAEPRLESDFQAWNAEGAERADLILARAYLVVLADLFVAARRLQSASSGRGWLRLFGVPEREIELLPTKLGEWATTVERLNRSVLLGAPAVFGRISAEHRSRLESLPETLRDYALFVRSVAPTARQYTPEKIAKRERDAALSELLLAAAKPVDVPVPRDVSIFPKRVPFEAVARLLNAVSETLGVAQAPARLESKLYTGERLKMFRRRLRLKQMLGEP